MRSEIASVVTHISGYGNAIVDGREKNQWLKSINNCYCQGFSESVGIMQFFERHALWFLLLVPIGIGVFMAWSEQWHIAVFLGVLGIFGYNDASKGRLDFDLDDF